MTKTKKEEPFKLFASIEESREYLGGADNENAGEWRYRGTEGINFNLISIHSSMKDSYGEEVDADFNPKDIPDGTTTYTVVVRFSSGDTFSSTKGDWSIVGTYLDKEKVAKIAEDIKLDQEDYLSIPRYKRFDKSKNKKRFIPPYGYCPWEGYFERFECVEIYCRPLNKTDPCPGIYWK